jgi:Bacterial Ig domain
MSDGSATIRHVGRPTAGSRSRARATPARQTQARRGTRRAGSTTAPSTNQSRFRVGWARRIGIAGGLLLAAVSVAFAAQALKPGGHPTATASPAPTLDALAAFPPPILDALSGPTGAAAIDVHGTLVSAVPAGGSYRVRVYDNSRFRRDARLSTGDTSFTVGAVPLVAGDNSLTATISAGDSETQPSVAVTIERDATAPEIAITAPAPGTTVYGDTLLLTGTTEPGATVRLSNRTNGANANGAAAGSGDFSLSLRLQLGNNALALTSTDEFGNSSQRNLSVARAVSQAAVTVELSRVSYDLATLPESITMTAHVVGPDGKPASGATVTFSISPPGQTTVTRQLKTTDGIATWSDYPLTLPGAVTGSGLVTVLATVSDGEQIAASAEFTYR